ncbi:hypothetical protein SLG_03340 [Sphingobium sp. SYK-6]|uniref:SOS response-associated peptidase n=1 Tax=Sphingobium sp. (strain NBRC 103272 / SYK-6) TaxID=627192 RepID=UPI0002276DE5|nr:SOS response-associated peptidase family protein [Sphingobium sp. SYK-6]BAK65009.1 hypothetical protein SLG_03340 [Sphingobium sp. SYK-6]
MTRLYRLDAPAEAVAAMFSADRGEDPWAGGYVAPGRFAPVIIGTARGGRRMVPRLWGVPPAPLAMLAGEPPVAYVRNLDSPFWIGSLRHTAFRCLIPATSFQIWSQAVDPRTGKHAVHRVSLPGSRPFAFAGLWRDSEVQSFALLTCEPNRLLGAINPRSMPVILHREDQEHWLREDWRTARRLVAPFPSQALEIDKGPRLAPDQGQSLAVDGPE